MPRNERKKKSSQRSKTERVQSSKRTNSKSRRKRNRSKARKIVKVVEVSRGFLRGNDQVGRRPSGAKPRRRHSRKPLLDMDRYSGEGSGGLAVARKINVPTRASRLSPYAAQIVLNAALPFDSEPVRIRNVGADATVGNTAVFKNFQTDIITMLEYKDVDLPSVPYIMHSGLEHPVPLYDSFDAGEMFVTVYRNPYILYSYPVATGAKIGNAEVQPIGYTYINGPVASPNWTAGKGYQLTPPYTQGDQAYIDINYVFNSPSWKFNVNGANPQRSDDLTSIPVVINGENLYLPFLDFLSGTTQVFGGNQSFNVEVQTDQYQSIGANQLYFVVERYIPGSAAMFQVARQPLPAAGTSSASRLSIPYSAFGNPVIVREASSGYFKFSIEGSIRTNSTQIEQFLAAFVEIVSFTSLRTLFVRNNNYPTYNGTDLKTPCLTSVQPIANSMLIMNLTPDMYKGGSVTGIAGNKGSDWSRYTSSIKDMNNINLLTNNYYTGNLSKGIYGFVKPQNGFQFSSSYTRNGDGTVFPFVPGIINVPGAGNDGYNVHLLQPPENVGVPYASFKFVCATIYEGQTQSQLFKLKRPDGTVQDVFAAQVYLSDFNSFTENPLHLSTIIKTVAAALKTGVHFVAQNKDWISSGLDAITSFFG